ncbi:hypothetical protein [Arcanobacterium buesumense]|uniref:Carrier domain-containing protein n=1 Tax=Arcanobacterium buesumense TaxID=2722751 RepID=A0A6H2EL23_9ACTO|nr:hypothetical protein [Arcanobacterium buesumense]QJC21641.1 hypothetical protein HC352_03395 [Arcanobacterium buesumense]
MEDAQPQDLALARIRVALDEIAPEIPDAEIVPQARLIDDLHLDEVSVWALVTNLEMLAKKHIADALIHQAHTVNDLIELIADKPIHAPKEEEVHDVASAMADLATLFNQR